jgi:hypothetical protein
MVAGCQAYAAPPGLGFIWVVGFYKDAAPTALEHAQPPLKRTKFENP